MVQENCSELLYMTSFSEYDMLTDSGSRTPITSKYE